MIKEIVKLWGHQKTAVERAVQLPEFAFFFEQGCLSHDTEISVSRGKATRKYSIEQLYRSFNSTELSLGDVGFNRSTPTFTRSWLGDRYGLNEILRVIRSGEKDVYLLETSERYKSLKLTADHKVFTKRGWVSANALEKGDEIAVDVLTKHLKKVEKYAKPKNRYPCLQVGRFHPYAYKIKNHGKLAYRLETHRIQFDAFLNRMSFEDFRRATHDETMVGKLIFTDPKVHHIHHKNEDIQDNSIENLERLTVSEHLRHHTRGYENFQHGNMNWRSFQSLTYIGKEMTYDITCRAPHHNFVANKILVHNCGKTLATITTLRHKYFEKKRLMRTIIFCPPIVIDNWRNEFLKYSAIKSWDILTLTGSQKERVQNLYMFGFQEENKKRMPLGKILIVNYEALLMIDLMRLIYSWKPEVLVCDESHRCKDPKSKRSQVLFTLTKDMKLRYILSGTPILNSPMDIYAQFRILDDGATFTNNFFAFRAKYFYDKNAGMPKQKYFPDWQPKPGCEEEIHALIAKKSMRVTKAECLDLPPLVFQKVYVDLSPEQRRVYNDMKADFVAYLKDKACVATLAITKGLRLLQILSGFMSVEETDGTNVRQNIQFEDNPRAKVLSELLSEITPHSKVLIWAVFKENYETIRTTCKALELDFVEIHGEVSQEKKMEAVAKFNSDPNCKVLFGHPASAGIGINLVAASYSIFYSRNFSLEQSLQAEARNHRGGSELLHEKVTRIDLVARDTIDEMILESLLKKEDVAKKILEFKGKL